LFLTEEECFALLAGHASGHVNFTRHALPSALPATCTVEGHEVVLHGAPESGLERLLDTAMVALEVDVTDDASHSAWRVVVVGMASAVSTADDRLVRIHPTDVTGHRLPSPRVA
jgi:nitroimidazol reductase NimA-like FMN-containing flavoprotein (pyridoxamine 5'-phosphate oxidase superfamily)